MPLVQLPELVLVPGSMSSVARRLASRVFRRSFRVSSGSRGLPQLFRQAVLSAARRFLSQAHGFRPSSSACQREAAPAPRGASSARGTCNASSVPRPREFVSHSSFRPSRVQHRFSPVAVGFFRLYRGFAGLACVPAVSSIRRSSSGTGASWSGCFLPFSEILGGCRISFPSDLDAGSSRRALRPGATTRAAAGSWPVPGALPPAAGGRWQPRVLRGRRSCPRSPCSACIVSG